MLTVVMLDFVLETCSKYILLQIHTSCLKVLVLTVKRQDTFLTQFSNTK